MSNTPYGMSASPPKSNGWGDVFAFCSELEQVNPGIFEVLRGIIENNATELVAMKLSELIDTYEYMRGDPFPIVGDLVFIRRCLMTIPGVVATRDGQSYYYCVGDP